MASPDVHPKDTWSSLAMKHYGDALLGVRLAEANGVSAKTKPIEVGELHFPPVEQLDPDRLAAGPGPGAADAFADDEASVVKEARYRMVMAMGGSGAVNESPQSVSTREVKKIDPKSREQRIEEAKENRVDLIEKLGEADGQALVLDVKPTRRPREADQIKRPSTKDNLAKNLAANDGKDLILELKPGAQRPEADDEDEPHMGDALAAQDGKALILEVKATKRKKKKKKKKADGSPEDEDGPAMGERFGDQLAKLDGKAMILDVRASTNRKETEEQKKAKKKRKATAELFSDLADRDGKELVLDLNIQVKDEDKLALLKEKRKLAKKRKRRTGSGSLIPKEWRAEGKVGSDAIEDYLDELKDQREYEADYFGDDTDASTNPVAKAAKATEHRSHKTARSGYAEGKRRQASKGVDTEGYGAFDEIQNVDELAGRIAAPEKRKLRPGTSEPAVEDAVEDPLADLNQIDDPFGVPEDTNTTPGGDTAPGVPEAQERPADLVASQPDLRPSEAEVPGQPGRPRRETKDRDLVRERGWGVEEQAEDKKERHPKAPPRPQKKPATPAAPERQRRRAAAPANVPIEKEQVDEPERRPKPTAAPPPPGPRHAAQPGPRAQAPAAAGRQAGPRRGPTPAAPRRGPTAPQRTQPQAEDWDDTGPAAGAAPPAGAADDWDDDDGFSGLSGLSGLSGVSRTGMGGGALPPVSASDPFAPEAMARLCMLSPGSVMQVARSAPVGAGPVLQLIGSLREAKEERAQTDLMRKFVNQYREEATATLEMLLTT